MKQYVVKVNHTGICDGHHYTAGKDVTLPENVVKALGTDALVVSEVKEEPAQETKREEKPEEKKEIKNPFNKMIGSSQGNTKIQTK